MILFVGWVVKRLMKLYVDCCNDLSQPPNLILLKKLYKLQVQVHAYVNCLFTSVFIRCGNFNTYLSYFPSLELVISKWIFTITWLLKYIYYQVSEDEIDASDCGLEDVPAAPLLNALKLHMTIAALNISHNSLGDNTWILGSSNKYFGHAISEMIFSYKLYIYCQELTVWRN